MTKISKVLDGHKKVGSTFIAPLNNLPKMKSISFVDQILPELIWIGLINDNIGYIRGARLIERVFLIIDNLETKNEGSFAFLSTYNALNENEKENLLNLFDSNSLLEPLRRYLAPLLLLYDEFPMKFIGLPDDCGPNEKLIEQISRCVGNHRNKYDTPGIVLNGAVLLSRLVTRKISLPAGLPDFNAVIEQPDSDEANRAAGFMRANVLSEVGMLEISNKWAAYFWEKSYGLTPCRLEFRDQND